MFENTKKLLTNKNFINIFLYGIIGALSAAVDFSIFTILVKFFALHRVIANLISMHIGMLVSFTLNSCFNFKKTDKIFRRFFSYYLIVLVGMGISSLILEWLSNLMPVLLTKVIAMMVVSVIQYILNRYITYHF